MAYLCDRCEGTGREMRGLDEWACDACNGAGFISEAARDVDAEEDALAEWAGYPLTWGDDG